jgi:D-glycero-alpha-D-manno-heptose 1-phosphate guanylyltransferase
MYKQRTKEVSNIPLIVLCGGRGTRLAPVLPDCPKILAPLGTETLLDILMKEWHRAGLHHIILSVGYLKEHIKEHVARKQYAVRFSEEKEPLGTGGALAHAIKLTNEKRLFVTNGDMLFTPDWEALYRFHRRTGKTASLYMARAYAGNGGTVITVNREGTITSWREKQAADQPEHIYLNAGAYCIEASIARFFPHRQQFSFEQDVLSHLVPHALSGLKTDAPFLDIGTPERYTLAKKERL